MQHGWNLGCDLWTSTILESHSSVERSLMRKLIFIIISTASNGPNSEKH